MKPEKPKGEGEEEGWNLLGMATMATNVLSSVSIALCLKALFLSNSDIPMSGLVVFHMFCSMVLTNVLYFFGWFEIPTINWPFLLAYSAAQALAIVTSNINLMHNSIGTYQMSKLAVIPVIATIETTFRLREPPSYNVVIALLVVMVGVGLATVHDVEITFSGFLWAMTAVMMIASVQILTGRQKQQNLSALQLLHLSTGISIIFLLVATSYLENLSSFFARGISAYELVLVVLSGLLSVSVNVTVLFIIAGTSPITYQVLGHLKSISLIVVGTILFRSPMSPLQLLGIVIALVGTARYGQLKLG
jgi:solute carrier family 35, member E3